MLQFLPSLYSNVIFLHKKCFLIKLLAPPVLNSFLCHCVCLSVCICISVYHTYEIFGGIKYCQTANLNQLAGTILVNELTLINWRVNICK